MIYQTIILWKDVVGCIGTILLPSLKGLHREDHRLLSLVIIAGLNWMALIKINRTEVRPEKMILLLSWANISKNAKAYFAHHHCQMPILQREEKNRVIRVPQLLRWMNRLHQREKTLFFRPLWIVPKRRSFLPMMNRLCSSPLVVDYPDLRKVSWIYPLRVQRIRIW